MLLAFEHGEDAAAAGGDLEREGGQPRAELAEVGGRQRAALEVAGK